MGFVLGLCVGIIFGCIVSFRVSGTLHLVETDEPTGRSYLFLELSEDVNSVSKKKYATFKIGDTISQK